MAGLGAISGSVEAGSTRPLCANLPRQAWLSYVEISLRVEEQGLQLVRVRLNEQNCYTVEVRDPTGKQRKGVMHPVTAEWMEF